MDGIDVSNNNGPIDWPRVAKAGKTFSGIKATEGRAFVDPYFAENWLEAKAAGLCVGAYHFAHPEEGMPVEEARHFLATLPTLVPSDFVALDIEVPEATSNRSAWALTWLRTVEAALGFKPLVYSSLDWLTRNLTDPTLAAYPLWLAAWGSTCPARAGVWPVVSLWQHTATLSVLGIAGSVDGDQLAGDIRALGKPVPKPSYPRPAIVAVAGSLKTAPSHASSVAIDNRKPPQPVWLEAGADLVLTGPATHSDDWWIPCRLVGGETVVHGWLPQNHVAEPAGG